MNNPLSPESGRESGPASAQTAGGFGQHVGYGSAPYSEAFGSHEYGDMAQVNRAYGVSEPRVPVPASGAAVDDADSVCPRHLDRFALVKCQRCARSACSECQHRAAVGVHCVDCVREAAASQRAAAPRGYAGAPLSSTPIVTYGLIALCTVMSVLQWVGLDGLLSRYLMFIPLYSKAMPWTVVTSAFLHGGLVHLLFNMYGLWIVGRVLEQRLGSARFAGIFLLSVIAGHATVLLIASITGSPAGWLTGTVGASGGLFGLFGALFVVHRRMGGETAQILVLIALNFGLGILYPNISWQAHLGGLVIGAAVTALLFALRPKRVPGVDVAVLNRKAALIHAAVFVGTFVVLALVVWIAWTIGLSAAAAKAGF